MLNKIDDNYTYDDIEYPVNFDDIKQFEKIMFVLMFMVLVTIKQ